MEAVEGAKTLDNPIKPLNSLAFSTCRTLLGSPLRLVVNLWTILPAPAAAKIVHSLYPGCTAAVHTLLAQLANELLPVLPKLAVGLHEGADLAAGVKHRGVVAAREGIADLG